jgi:hypothetical protein
MTCTIHVDLLQY